MQGMREIRCRAGGFTGGAKAMLLFEDGMREEHALDGGEEVCWTAGEHRLTGGYIHADGRMLSATGDAMRSMFAADRQAARADEHKRVPGMEKKKEERQEEGGRERRQQEQRQWPQRRWPPPPCWPQAQYIRGRWTEAEQHVPGS